MPIITSSPEIWHRLDLPILANWRKLFSAVEVGVERGTYSNHFLSLWQGQHYYGVDDYQPYPDMPYDREGDRHAALTTYARHAARAKLIIGKSVEVAASFAPASIDFIYLDAAHDYDSVMADLRAWWPVLSDRGILSGHDFDDDQAHEGVKRAVTEFATEVGQAVYITAVPGYGQEPNPSFYLYKAGMPDSLWRRC